MKKIALPLLLAAFGFAALGLVACGSSDSSSSSTSAATSTPAGDGDNDVDAGAGGTGTGATIKFSADPSGQLAYTETNVTAKAGDDTISFDNPAPLEHDVVIEDADGNEVASTETVSNGSVTADAQLEPGKYAFFCSVDGHRDAGMEGTLTVK
jgi:plastocyanin